MQRSMRTDNKESDMIWHNKSLNTRGDYDKWIPKYNYLTTGMKHDTEYLFNSGSNETK